MLTEKSLNYSKIDRILNAVALSRKLEMNGISFHYIEYLNLYCRVTLFII